MNERSPEDARRGCRARAGWRSAVIAAVLLTVIMGGVAPRADGQTPPAPLRNMITPATERAIASGLDYLRKRQARHGGWDERYSVASTAASIMAFMVTGELPEGGDDAQRVAGGLTRLLEIGRANAGYMGTGDKGMYEHALATLALAEAAGEAEALELMPALEAAVGVIISSQNEAGGWRYTPGDNQADLSVSAMQVVALVAASEAGVAVPEQTMSRARVYLESCYDAERGGYRYQPGNREAGFARTAAGAAAMMFIAGPDHKQVAEAVRFIAANREAALEEKYFYYGHYYAAQCMYRAGEQQHQQWYPFVRDALLERQRADGSWTGSPGGDGLSTAMAIIVLGADYHYLPIYQR